MQRWATDWMIGGSILCRGWKFFHHRRVQTSSGAHAASYPVGTRGSFPGEGGGSGQGVKLNIHLHLVPRSKNERSYNSTHQYAFMAQCSLKKSKGTVLPLAFMLIVPDPRFLYVVYVIYSGQIKLGESLLLLTSGSFVFPSPL
jgi:hypothetical protein